MLLALVPISAMPFPDSPLAIALRSGCRDGRPSAARRDQPSPGHAIGQLRRPRHERQEGGGTGRGALAEQQRQILEPVDAGRCDQLACVAHQHLAAAIEPPGHRAPLLDVNVKGVG